ncbi:tripartite tricarboxylate transporter TctB family protein [Alkalicoccus saliphilus]|uniref:DUF1468 domain-containing protein n=1 Tax=Alkalicoccus saliphilus TaxID=200989 RepID=A0A2T4U3X4_9BACI|nr:tripartite tricarboxylate transporter TctB family protein [Alkalicoccus saliphilus]PTL38103.1 hypothetical protein C6Y45_12975 [Alkalicoccus saliphilus]
MTHTRPKMQLVHRMLLPTAIFIFITLYFLEVQGLNDSRDRMLITPIYWVMTLMYPIILFQEWEKWKSVENEKVDESKVENDEQVEVDEGSEVDAPLTKKVLSFMLSIFFYLLLVEQVGFVIITLIFIPTLMWLLGTKNWKLLIIMPITVTALLYLLFVTWLGIPLPEGILE